MRLERSAGCESAYTGMVRLHPEWWHTAAAAKFERHREPTESHATPASDGKMGTGRRRVQHVSRDRLKVINCWKRGFGSAWSGRMSQAYASCAASRDDSETLSSANKATGTNLQYRMKEEQRVKDRQDTAHIVSSPPAVPGPTDAS
jgi:hypothetical protein